jgi:hypothetical protein
MKTKLSSWGTKLSTSEVLIYLSNVGENLSMRGYKFGKSTSFPSTFALFYMKDMLSSSFTFEGRNDYVSFNRGEVKYEGNS